MKDHHLLPIFRSDTQFRILGELFTAPREATFSVGEMTSRAGVSQASASRELDRLEQAGLVLSERRGNQRLVRANERSPVADDLRSLLTKLYGAPARIRSALASLDGIAEAYLFGSYARRLTGEPGTVPNDIDLLVLGDVAIDDVWTVAAELSRELRIEVNPVVRSSTEWEDDRSGFATDVKSQPVIDVTPWGQER